jgi:hypothetical protein
VFKVSGTSRQLTIYNALSVEVADYGTFLSFAPQTDSSNATLSFAESSYAFKQRRLPTSSKFAEPTSQYPDGKDEDKDLLSEEGIDMDLVLKNISSKSFGGVSRADIRLQENRYLLREWQELQIRKSGKGVPLSAEDERRAGLYQSMYFSER